MLAATTLLAGLVSAWALLWLQRAADLHVASAKASGGPERTALAEAAEEVRRLGTDWLAFLVILMIASAVLAIVRAVDGDLRVESAAFTTFLALGCLVLSLSTRSRVSKAITKVKAAAAV